MALFCLSVLVAPLAAAGTAGLADHVVLISVDGLRPEFYLDPAWPAPMMQQMRSEGAYAERVRGVFPSVTYPSHTTMVTGALPARHGIYYNSPFEPGGESGRWHWEAAAIRVPTLWDAVRRAGRESASLTWPVTVGAPIDRNLPEVWSIEPGAVPLARLRELTTPAGLWEEIEREATGRLTAANFLMEQMTRDDRAGDVAAYLLETYRPALLAVHLLEVDHFQHEDGRDGPRVRRAVATVDRAIAQVVETAERAGILDRTAFIVTGDHGHVDRHTLLAPNVWLVAAGLQEDRPDRGHWRATFHTTGASAFLHLADPGDDDAVATVLATLDALPAGIRRLFKVLDRAALDRLSAAPDAALALAPMPGVDFTSDPHEPAVRPTHGATHGYLFEFPEIYTGFVGWGAGFRPGATAPVLGLEDVAPLVATLLGLDFEAPDGVVPLGLLATAAEPVE